MPALLPGQIVVVVEGIVGKDLRIRICAQITDAVADALSGESHILLSAKRNADFCVPSVAKESRRIAGNTIVPAHPGESEAKLIYDRR